MNKPMFYIEDSKRIDLTRNETGAEQLLRARGVTDLRATGNKAGLGSEPPRGGAWFRDHVAVGVIAPLVVIAIVGALVWFWPDVRPFIK